eukprot:scaffold179482_cov40-Tisochrysis_lutea.AAC.3
MDATASRSPVDPPPHAPLHSEQKSLLVAFDLVAIQRLSEGHQKHCALEVPQALACVTVVAARSESSGPDTRTRRWMLGRLGGV